MKTPLMKSSPQRNSRLGICTSPGLRVGMEPKINPRAEKENDPRSTPAASSQGWVMFAPKATTPTVNAMADTTMAKNAPTDALPRSRVSSDIGAASSRS